MTILQSKLNSKNKSSKPFCQLNHREHAERAEETCPLPPNSAPTAEANKRISERHMQVTGILKQALYRNRLLITAIAVAFFGVMMITIVVTYLVLISSSGLVDTLQSWVQSSASYMAIPPPYTNGLYRFIFLNNIGHFWNPIRLWVWIPFVGAFELGYELLLNAILIGVVASFVGVTKGPLYTFAGLAPHGVIELPAFILEFTGLARWHVSTTRALYTKLSGRSVDQPLLRQGVKDTIVLSLLSVALFAVAAYVETFITPRFLGR